MTEEDLYQVALLVDQLRHEDVQFRVHALSSVEVIAAALGAERTRDELVPFLADMADDDDDVLLALVAKIGRLADFVGGAEHLHVLLRPLELFIAGEDGDIRDQALAAADAIVQKMTAAQIQRHVLPMIAKLSSRDWFTARSGAALLCALVFPRLDATLRCELLPQFVALAQDATPAVRRSSAKALASVAAPRSRDLCSLSDAELTQFCALLEHFVKDEQDSIRIQAIQASVALAALLPSDLLTRHVVPALLCCASDRSWRVRWSLAHCLADVIAQLQVTLAAPADAPAAALGACGNALAPLYAAYESLLADSEAEVRSAAATRFTVLAASAPRPQLLRLFPALQRLAVDSADFVRAAAASVLAQLLPRLAQDDVANQLLPCLLTLLRDDRAEVRLNVVAQLQALHVAMGADFLRLSLLPALVELAQDRQWRVRLAVIEQMPRVAAQLGVAFFTDSLVAVCLAWLQDQVFSIRRAAADALQQLMTQFGDAWTATCLLPRLLALKSGHRVASTQRLTLLVVIAVLLRHASDVALLTALTTVALDMAADPVANVRLAAAKALVDAAGRPLDADARRHVAAALHKLTLDADRDVRFFANKSLASLQ